MGPAGLQEASLHQRRQGHGHVAGVGVGHRSQPRVGDRPLDGGGHEGELLDLGGNTQILELIGTQAFENFVRELEKEGLGIATTKTPPKPGVKVYPVAEKVKYDIEIPRTTALFERAYKNIEKLDPAAFGPLATEEDLDKDLSRLIQLEHGTVGVTVHSDEVEFNDDNVPAIENLLSSLTKRVMHKARITTGFPTLFTRVREYVRERCFGHKVELEEVGVRRALNNGALLESIARVFARRIGELTTEQRSVEVVGEPYRLSDTPEFTWRRQSVVADRTIFNVVACYRWHGRETGRSALRSCCTSGATSSPSRGWAIR